MLRLSWAVAVLGCLVGLITAQDVMKVQLSSCKNQTFEISCNSTNTTIRVISASHSAADIRSCANCAPSCMVDSFDYSYDYSYSYDRSYGYPSGSFGRSSGRRGYHGRRRRSGRYQGPLGRLCNGLKVCRLQRWCETECVETFNITYHCSNFRRADVTRSPPSGSTPTPPPGGAPGGRTFNSVPGFELQTATLSTCKNQTFELSCSAPNTSLVVVSALHWVAELWQCRQCAAGCMGDEVGSGGYPSHSQGYHSHPRGYLSQVCNGRNRCVIDKGCQQANCVETYNVTYYCIDSTINVQTTCLYPKASAPDLVLLKKCPVRVNPSARVGGSGGPVGGSQGGRVLLTVVTPSWAGYKVCRWSDQACRDVFTQNYTTSPGGFSLISHDYYPLLLKLEYLGGLTSTLSPPGPNSPSLGPGASFPAVTAKSGPGASVPPVTAKSGGSASQPTVRTGFASGNSVGGTVQTRTKLDPNEESPIFNVNGSRQGTGPGSAGTTSPGSVEVVIIVIVIVIVLALVGVVVLVIALRKRKQKSPPPSYLHREPVVHNFYVGSAQSNRSSTGTEGTEWMTPEQMENQHNLEATAPPAYDVGPAAPFRY